MSLYRKRHRKTDQIRQVVSGRWRSHLAWRRRHTWRRQFAGRCLCGHCWRAVTQQAVVL